MTIYNEIKKDRQIWKFCFYGFFKNLKFFEPYLLVYMIGMGLSLFQVGLLYSVREIITYLFEVPSGIIADHFGKKKELLMCFAFYIVSFIFFFIGSSFNIMALGMVFFGLGEAFRSGTHKAIILGYLEHNGWFEHKGFVYGRTRSFSLLGSSISAFLSILLVFNLPALRWLFLICIIPYLADFLLIASYPAYLDETQATDRTIKAFYMASVEQLKRVRRNVTLQKILVSSAVYDGYFKAIKDYIQPILAALILGTGASVLWGLSSEQSLKVYLGLIYGVFYIFSSMASRNVHKITQKYRSMPIFYRSFDVLGLMMLILAFVVQKNFMWLSILAFFFIYLLKDARRPVFVDVCSDYMSKDQRATVLSIESQIRSLLMIVTAPVLGYIADTFSISSMFLVIGLSMIALNRFLQIGD